MGKVQHRKSTRSARESAGGAPLSRPAPTSNGHAAGADEEGGAGSSSKKVGKKEADASSLIDRLKGTDAAARLEAAAELAQNVTSLAPGTLRLLLGKNLVGALIERAAKLATNEEDVPVVVECVGCLRNLAVSQPLSLLSEMSNKKLLAALLPSFTLLSASLPSILSSTIPPPGSREAAIRSHFADWAENLATIVWCLAESTAKLLAGLNVQLAAILPLLMGLVAASSEQSGKKKLPAKVGVTALQALYALVADNPPALSALRRGVPGVEAVVPLLSASPAATNATPSPLEEEEQDLRGMASVLAFGVLLEVVKSSPSPSAAQKKGKGKQQDADVALNEIRALLRSSARAVLCSSLGTDLPGVAASAIQLVSTSTAADAATATMATLTLASYERKLGGLQSALEVLGEWCTSLDELGPEEEEDEWRGIGDDMEVEGESSDDDDEIIRKERDGDEGMDEEVAPLPSSTRDLLLNLPSHLLALTRPTQISFAPLAAADAPEDLLPAATGAQKEAPRKLEAVVDALSAIHVRAMGAMNNVLIPLARTSGASDGIEEDEEEDGQDGTIRAAGLTAVWEGILLFIQENAAALAALPAATPQEPAEIEKLRALRWEALLASTGSAWGVARVTRGLGAQEKDAKTLLDVLALMEMGQGEEGTREEVRVRVVGALGVLGRREAVGEGECHAIGQAALALLPTSTTSYPHSPDVLLAALDALIDLFSDEDSPLDAPVFRANGYLQRLEAAVQPVRSAARRVDRKKFPERRARVDGGLENLVAFVKYRKGLGV